MSWRVDGQLMSCLFLHIFLNKPYYLISRRLFSSDGKINFEIKRTNLNRARLPTAGSFWFHYSTNLIKTFTRLAAIRAHPPTVFFPFSSLRGSCLFNNSTLAKNSILETRAVKVGIDFTRFSWHFGTISWSNSNRYLATRSPLVLFTTNHCSVVMGGAYFPECQVRVSFPSGRHPTPFFAFTTS